MPFQPIKATDGTLVPVLAVTDTTVTIQHPRTGDVKTIARAPWYRPHGPPVHELAKPKRKAVATSHVDTNIGLGIWSAVHYDDGSGRAWLSEVFEESPFYGPRRLLPAQLEALATYEKHGAKGIKWGPR